MKKVVRIETITAEATTVQEVEGKRVLLCDIKAANDIFSTIAEIDRLKQEGQVVFEDGTIGLHPETKELCDRGKKNLQASRVGGEASKGKYQKLWPEIIEAAKGLRETHTASSAAKYLHAQFLREYPEATPSESAIRKRPQIKGLFRK